MSDLDQRLRQSPRADDVRTFYERPVLDRISARYVVAWTSSDGEHRIRVHNRLRDLQGRPPSWRSVLRLPHVLATYWAVRRKPLLTRPLPFLTYDAIRQLAQIVAPGTRVLELGSGNSTLWLLQRGAHVTSIEHDPTWASSVRAEAEQRGFGARLALHCEDGSEALARIANAREAEFDLALIDCKNAFTSRYHAVELARAKVRSGGWLCLDNSDHPNNWAAAELMADRPRWTHSGYGPMCAVVTQTSLWQL